MTVTFQPSRGWAPKIPHPENRVAAESVSSPLAHCSGVVSMRRVSQQPTFLPGFLGTPCPKAGWPTEMTLLVAHQNLLSGSFVLFCVMTSALGEALAPHVWPEDFPDDALGRRQQAELWVSDPSWLHILDRKER